MESQFTLFEKPESKGIKDIGAHVPQYTECESLENSYGDYLRHCNRVKSQARLPNEILDTFRQQVTRTESYSFLSLSLCFCPMILLKTYSNHSNHTKRTTFHWNDDLSPLWTRALKLWGGILSARLQTSDDVLQWGHSPFGPLQIDIESLCVPINWFHLNRCYKLTSIWIWMSFIYWLCPQIASGMDNQIVLGLLYCILTNHNPSCNYVCYIVVYWLHSLISNINHISSLLFIYCSLYHTVALGLSQGFEHCEENDCYQCSHETDGWLHSVYHRRCIGSGVLVPGTSVEIEIQWRWYEWLCDADHYLCDATYWCQSSHPIFTQSVSISTEIHIQPFVCTLFYSPFSPFSPFSTLYTFK